MRQLQLLGRNAKTKIVLGESAKNLGGYFEGKSAAFVVDKNVALLHKGVLPKENVVEIAASEKAKSFDGLQKIFEKFLDFGLDRGSFVVGIGGGIVCDLTGFAAATFLRGVRFGFVPTTLLAQVDASVGGKNSVNFGGYKNIVGTIAQPEFVLCDFDFLKTLPVQELRNGLAEVIKGGAIADAQLFSYIEEHSNLVFSLHRTAIEKVVNDSLVVKTRIVGADEMEFGERKKLNFGHTVGHGLEKIKEISHGQAVSIGMVVAANLSVSRGILSQKEAQRISQLLEKTGLPTRTEFDKNDLLEAIKKDKKRFGDKIDFVLLNGIGNAVISKVGFEELGVALNDLR